jgi:hypothetical protein
MNNWQITFSVILGLLVGWKEVQAILGLIYFGFLYKQRDYDMEKLQLLLKHQIPASTYSEHRVNAIGTLLKQKAVN